MMLMAMAKHVLQRLLAGLRSWQPRRRRRPTTTSKPRVVIRRFGTHPTPAPTTPPPPPVTIRVATFNAAMFSMAPPEPQRDVLCKPANGQQDPGQRPKSILKAAGLPQSPSKQLRVSINLQDDEISLERASKLQKAATTSNTGGGGAMENGSSRGYYVKGKAAAAGGGRSAVEVLREVGADVIALQNVRAEEERGMRPLSELAEGLGMRYVFADSWAPEYGNAVLSRWPIKRWKAQRVADHSDFRNVLRATIEVPKAGELNFHCTHLDHLDEGWRMAQINSMLRSSDGGPHILAGGLNALDRTDYSTERWANIVKYYEEIGKPTPRAEVMKYLKGKQYVDAKDFAGECQAVVVVAKGQDVQGTCKYGTRVDYILASPNSPYRFVPGSYAVISSKGTSDHHIVKADITIGNNINESDAACRRRKRRVMKMNRGSTKGVLAAR